MTAIKITQTENGKPLLLVDGKIVDWKASMQVANIQVGLALAEAREEGIRIGLAAAQPQPQPAARPQRPAVSPLDSIGKIGKLADRLASLSARAPR